MERDGFVGMSNGRERFVHHSARSEKMLAVLLEKLPDIFEGCSVSIEVPPLRNHKGRADQLVACCVSRCHIESGGG